MDNWIDGLSSKGSETKSIYQTNPTPTKPTTQTDQTPKTSDQPKSDK